MTFKGLSLNFTRGNVIGRGGNGAVFQIVCKPPREQSLVAKFLKKPRTTRDHNFQRFEKEVQAMVELGGKYGGIMPIFDYNLSSNDPWYVMPLAIPLKQHLFGRKANIMEKMDILTEVGKTLQNLHNEGYSHRDIKLDNILMYNNRVVLSDFGLVRHPDFERLTRKGEKVGPWNTIAPEMKRFVREIDDHRPADVYSFAKLIWIVLTEDEYCFDGQYEKVKSFGLKHSEFNVETLECVHQVLELSTDPIMSRRPIISRVLDELERWRYILGDKRLVVQEQRKTVRNEIRRELTPDDEYYLGLDSIRVILEKLLGLYSLNSKQIKNIPISTCKPSQLPGCLEISGTGGGNSIYLIKPEKLTVKNVSGNDGELEPKYLLDIGKIEDEELEQMKEIVIKLEDMSYLDTIFGNSIEEQGKIIALSGEKDITFA
ncbi:protein kinase [Paenibacillus sp. LMG 31459]|uniref:Protein kinase n=1 Tax=Paenibacillus phytohabitans TaxID=2654978 RepID=A0ABX1Y952_9BACL|nr:protein kinase [Paenibacillus phytohabitans]NOU77457.1 protein kinase [Paenibacillus phytohabitans]